MGELIRDLQYISFFDQNRTHDGRAFCAVLALVKYLIEHFKQLLSCFRRHLAFNPYEPPYLGSRSRKDPCCKPGSVVVHVCEESPVGQYIPPLSTPKVVEDHLWT